MLLQDGPSLFVSVEMYCLQQPCPVCLVYHFHCVYHDYFLNRGYLLIYPKGLSKPNLQRYPDKNVLGGCLGIEYGPVACWEHNMGSYVAAFPA